MYGGTENRSLWQPQAILRQAAKPASGPRRGAPQLLTLACRHLLKKRSPFPAEIEQLLQNLNSANAAKGHNPCVPLYEYRFVNHANMVFGQEAVECPSDDAAIDTGAVLFQSSIGKGYQIWCADRLVHTRVFD